MRIACRLFHAICICLCLIGTGHAVAASLPAGFAAALREAGIPPDAVAVWVQNVEAPQPVLAHRAMSAMNPASVMKLVTSLAALQTLGPAYTWKTDIWASGAVHNRILQGDLIIKGYGDPTLTLERMWLLQRELKARGIDAIHGSLILDTRYFDLPALDPGAFDGEPWAMYNALPAALLANYNAVPFTFQVVNDAVVISPQWSLPELAVSSRLVVDDAACGEWKPRIQIAPPDAARRELVFQGSYARDCGEKQLNLNALEAAQHFDALFRALWAESGGVLMGATRLGIAPSDRPPLFSFASIPLAEALRNLNKYSNNLMTRNLFLTLGAEQHGAPATLEKSIASVKTWLASQQIAAPELLLENGAGLSRVERISAHTLSRVLLTATQSPYFSEFESALPILAVDGTLKRRFSDSALAARAHLKTGTLQDTRALAGYLLNRDNQRMVFVMLVNHPRAEHAEAAQRVLLEWAYAQPAARGSLRSKK